MLTPTLRTRRGIVPLSHPAMPALSRAFAHPDEAARYAHEKIADRRDREYGGFILRRDDGRYVATIPMPGEGLSFNPARVFPFDEEEGAYLIPAGHQDYGMYHSHPAASFPKPHWWAEAELAIYVNFFSTPDIHTALTQYDFAPVSYLSGPDGCLLKYTSNDSLAERALLKRVAGQPNSPDIGDLSELDRATIEGTMLPSDIVRLLAATGDLQVVLASRLWGRVGKVTPDWTPYPSRNDPAVCESPYPPVQPLLSPVFKSADEVGRYVRNRIGNRPHEAIIGVLLKHPGTGDYRAVEPVVNGAVIDCRCSFLHPDAGFRPALHEGYRIDGLYFAPTTPVQQGGGQASELKRQFFEPADLHRLFDYRYVPAKRPRGMPVRYGFTLSEVYFCAPDGALLGYSPSRSPAEYELARQVSRTYSGSESMQSRLDSGRMSVRDFIGRVAGAGRLRVLVISDNWPQAGAV